MQIRASERTWSHAYGQLIENSVACLLQVTSGTELSSIIIMRQENSTIEYPTH